MISLNQLYPHLLYPFSSELELLTSLKRLWEGFTTHRDQLSRYRDDPQLVSAYTAYYMLTNLPKWAAVLERLPHFLKEELQTAQVIEVGAGPGTFLLAHHDYLQKKFDAYALELSPVMREQAKKIFKAFDLSPEDHVLSPTGWARIASSSNRVLVFGHSLNEMGNEHGLNYIRQLNPQTIYVIEPGTKAVFAQLLELRTDLLRAGYHQHYPCPHHLDCPMQSKKDDWCHQIFKVQQHPELERLGQIMHKDRRELPLCAHVFSRTAHARQSAVVVRNLGLTKASLRLEICRPDAHLETVEVLRRHLSKTEQDSQAFLAGEFIDFKVEKTLPDQTCRIKDLKKSLL